MDEQSLKQFEIVMRTLEDEVESQIEDNKDKKNRLSQDILILKRGMIKVRNAFACDDDGREKALEELKTVTATCIRVLMDYSLNSK